MTEEYPENLYEFVKVKEDKQRSKQESLFNDLCSLDGYTLKVDLGSVGYMSPFLADLVSVNKSAGEVDVTLVDENGINITYTIEVDKVKQTIVEPDGVNIIYTDDTIDNFIFA